MEFLCRSFLTFVLLYAPTAHAWNSLDIMVGNRKQVEGFSLGPAPFPDFKDMSYELFGDAFIRDDSVKVTDAQQHQKGAIWSKAELPISKTNDFQIDLTFRVGGSKNKDFFGDGFALWITNHESRGVGGNALGGPNRWKGLGVFFDTFKNDNLKAKRHPYVYAILNDGKTDYESIKTKDIDGQGCHIPLRSRDPDTLDTTVARVTYRNHKLSVLMQPYGAEDWLQCFQIDSVPSDLIPNFAYIGVTAMTGELVDKHHMVFVQAYQDILIDPYKVAVEYDLSQMPYMWEDMKHSGDVAKEFEDWEKDIEEELDFEATLDHYGTENYYYNQYSMVEDDYYVDKREKEFEKPSYKNNYRTDIPKGKGGVGKSKSKLSKEEMEKIDDMISQTKIASELRVMLEGRKKRMRKFRLHMESEFDVVTSQISDLVRNIRRKEYALSKRVEKMGIMLDVKVEEIFRQEARKGGNWKWPFAIVFILIATGTGLVYRQYRQHMKTHLL